MGLEGDLVNEARIQQGYLPFLKHVFHHLVDLEDRRQAEDEVVTDQEVYVLPMDTSVLPVCPL